MLRPRPFRSVNLIVGYIVIRIGGELVVRRPPRRRRDATNYLRLRHLDSDSALRKQREQTITIAVAFDSVPSVYGPEGKVARPESPFD